MLIQLALEGFRYLFIPEVTAAYRLHSGNKTDLKDIALQDGLRITDKIFQHLHLPLKYQKTEIYAFLQCLRYLETIRRCFVHVEHESAYIYLEQLYESIPSARIWMKASSIEDILENLSNIQIDLGGTEYDIGVEEVIRLKDILEGYVQSL